MRRISVTMAAIAALLLGVGLAAPAQAAVPAKKYNMQQVQQHSSPTDCWSVINGKVYNLTSWVNRHPGGSSRIIALCGRDGSAMFNGMHGMDPRAKGVLHQFKIGRLSR